MSKKLKLKTGWETCPACLGDGDDVPCGGCNDGQRTYQRPPRWLELLAAIVTRTEQCGCWMPTKNGVYTDIAGTMRFIHASSGGDASSLRSLERRGLIVQSKLWPRRVYYYEPSPEGVDELATTMAAFVRQLADGRPS